MVNGAYNPLLAFIIAAVEIYFICKIVGYFWKKFDEMKARREEANKPLTRQEEMARLKHPYDVAYAQLSPLKLDPIEARFWLLSSILDHKPELPSNVRRIFNEVVDKAFDGPKPVLPHEFEPYDYSQEGVQKAIDKIRKNAIALETRYYKDIAERLYKTYTTFIQNLPKHVFDDTVVVSSLPRFELSDEAFLMDTSVLNSVVWLSYATGTELLHLGRPTGFPVAFYQAFFKRYPDYAQVFETHFWKLLPAFAKPLAIPSETRFEHTWVVGPQGSGKTQLFQYLIAHDLVGMHNGACSIVVMDSQGDLINQISTLTSLQDNPNVILIQPDAIALNPFDMKGEQAVDMLTYVFRALGEGAEMTPKQSALYRYTIRLLLEIPEATLNTFVQILQPGGLEPYRKYIPQLSNPAQIFFANQFDDAKQFGQTKQEVAWRLMLLLENPTFERMFCAPRTKLNLFDELNTAKLILIDTNKQMLGSDRSALFGRFFISLLLHTSQQRAQLTQGNRLPVYCYIDEAHEYLQDDTVANILDQARKMRIGMVLANQRSTQVKNSNTLDALMTTSIKFVHTDNDRDTHLLARPLKTTPEFLAELPKQVFALFARNSTKEAVAVTVPFLVMEKMPHSSNEALKKRMKVKYGADPVKPHQRTETPPQDEEPKPKAKAKPKEKKDDTEASDSL